MSNKIPHEIKVNVIQLWLQGYFHNYVSKFLGIGKGTVTGIIQNTRLTMKDIDLLRAVAVTLHEEGVDIYTFASAINLQRKINESEWPQESIEWLIEEFKTLSFKTGIESKILLDKLISILCLSINSNIAIEESCYFLDVLENKKANLETGISIKKAELDKVTHDIIS
ncbi:MAG: hypothetical protein P0116_16950, partial [Candidatus Nitrosocosmicus sp.]|nr:hypothetical protein [Candidatus Nitrosocosmicus sp.]